MKILITGSAGFIGFHVSKLILEKYKNTKIIGLDSLNSYYDLSLKKKRLSILKKYKNFFFVKNNLLNLRKNYTFFKKNKFTHVIHLAAQAGVRYSFKNPRTYFDNNLVAFFNLLESCRVFKIKHLMFASTSSVYGDSKKFPVKEIFSTDFPLSFYAATKKSNEVMAYSYAKMFKMKITALRFFTVYGPYGRPDMALYKFTEKLSKNKQIELFNFGNHQRDFTFIDDAVDMVTKILLSKKNRNNFEIFNICNGKTRKLIDYIKLIEKNFKRKFKIKKIKLQKGDVHKTHGSLKKILKNLTREKNTNIEHGVKQFVDWYKKYHNIK